MNAIYNLCYRWKRYPLYASHGYLRCRIVKRGAKNSVEIEFKDGYRAIVSRWAVRKEPTHE